MGASHRRPIQVYTNFEGSLLPTLAGQRSQRPWASITAQRDPAPVFHSQASATITAANPSITANATFAAPPLALSDWDRDGLQVEFAALIEAAAPTDFYAGSPRALRGSLLEGNVLLGVDNNPITRIRYQSANSRIIFNDSSTIDLATFFGSGGAGRDLTLHFQTTQDNAQEVTVATAESGSAAAAARFNLPQAIVDLLDGIVAGDRFIIGAYRQAPQPLAASATITAANPSITVNATLAAPLPTLAASATITAANPSITANATLGAGLPTLAASATITAANPSITVNATLAASLPTLAASATITAANPSITVNATLAAPLPTLAASATITAANPSITVNAALGAIPGTALTLADWDDTGLQADVLALIRAADPISSDVLYSIPPRGTAGSLEDGELDMGADDAAITRIRRQSSGANLAINDNSDLYLQTYFGAGGAGRDLTIYIQTTPSDRVGIVVEDQLASTGGNFANVSVGATARAIFNGITAGSLFIFAMARPTPPLAASATITAANPSITANATLAASLPTLAASATITAANPSITANATLAASLPTLAASATITAANPSITANATLGAGLPTLAASATITAANPSITANATLAASLPTLAASATITAANPSITADATLVSITSDDESDAAYAVRIRWAPEVWTDTPTWVTLPAEHIFSVSTTRGRNFDTDNRVAGLAQIVLDNDDDDYWPDPDANYGDNPDTGMWLCMEVIRGSTNYGTVFVGAIESWGPRVQGSDKEILVQCVDHWQRLFVTRLSSSSGYPEERADLRVHRILDAAGWPTARRDINQAQENVAATGTFDDVPAKELLEQAADVELGVMHIDREGDFIFRARTDAANETGITFGPEYSAAFMFEFDNADRFVRNDISIARPGGVAQTASDSTSIDRYGRRKYVVTDLQVTSDSAASGFAQQYLNNFGTPRVRVRSIAARPHVPNADLDFGKKVLQAELGDTLDLIWGAAHLLATFQINQIVFKMSQNQYPRVTYRVSEVADIADYWQLGVSGSSELGETTVLYV